ncbi:hypothetical protein [Paraburkholderia antibiotica]|uniref:Uncharacterized protein n=1 Tax=Paraburkholderia antibiotica TaxID=2728839 RepID=A0A7X9ZZI6_9BURK|nr:hypothetical protein [Paraburkholderia antibiotica]NML33205.1 hypothetical protein [Paraburkholderia antibiotica]
MSFSLLLIDSMSMTFRPMPEPDKKLAAHAFMQVHRRPSPKLFHMAGKLGNTLIAYGYARLIPRSRQARSTRVGFMRRRSRD